MTTELQFVAFEPNTRPDIFFGGRIWQSDCFGKIPGDITRAGKLEERYPQIPARVLKDFIYTPLLALECRNDRESEWHVFGQSHRHFSEDSKNVIGA